MAVNAGCRTSQCSTRPSRFCCQYHYRLQALIISCDGKAMAAIRSSYVDGVKWGDITTTYPCHPSPRSSHINPIIPASRRSTAFSPQTSTPTKVDLHLASSLPDFSTLLASILENDRSSKRAHGLQVQIRTFVRRLDARHGRHLPQDLEAALQLAPQDGTV